MAVTPPGWVPEDYLESAVRDVLTADSTRVDTTIGFAALLLASTGAVAESDRLVTRWHELTERPVSLLAADPVHARAWTMLFAARGGPADWAGAMIPLDPDAEERAHAAYLDRADVNVPAGLLGDSTTAKIVSGLAAQLDITARKDPLRTAAAEAEAQARAGETEGARSALRAWAERARGRARPDVPALIACRHVAPLLIDGADPLALGEDWAATCAGDLIAALHTRYPANIVTTTWPELIAAIRRLRGAETELPSPADPEALTAAERRLGARLPADYRGFLLTCDGLGPDDVFPRLLGVAELRTADGGVVPISERGEHGMILLTPIDSGWLVVDISPGLGTTTHPSFRRLLEEHLRLLGQAR